MVFLESSQLTVVAEFLTAAHQSVSNTQDELFRNKPVTREIGYEVVLCCLRVEGAGENPSLFMWLFL